MPIITEQLERCDLNLLLERGPASRMGEELDDKKEY